MKAYPPALHQACLMTGICLSSNTPSSTVQCRPFKRPRLGQEEEPADGSVQTRVVRSRPGSSQDQDSTMQDATPAATPAAAPVGATASIGSSPSQPTSQPALPNGLPAEVLGDSSHSENATQEASPAAAANGFQDAHMQGTSLPPANGFAAGIASAMATALPSNALNGGSHTAEADVESRPRGGAAPKDRGSSVHKGPATDASATEASADAGQMSEDGQSTSATKGLKRMSWMEPNGGATADWQVIEQADGQANGKAPGQPNGKALSKEDDAGAASPLSRLCNATTSNVFEHVHCLSMLHMLHHRVKCLWPAGTCCQGQ